MAANIFPDPDKRYRYYVAFDIIGRQFGEEDRIYGILKIDMQDSFQGVVEFYNDFDKINLLIREISQAE